MITLKRDYYDMSKRNREEDLKSNKKVKHRSSIVDSSASVAPSQAMEPHHLNVQGQLYISRQSTEEQSLLQMNVLLGQLHLLRLERKAQKESSQGPMSP